MELNIEYLKVEDLKPYEKNARKHEEKDLATIIASIREFGMNDPIGIWSNDNIVVEGHGRLMACKIIGIDKVPTIRLDHLSDEQRRAYALAHNKTAEMSDWNLDILNFELGEIADIDMSNFGFDMDFNIDTEDNVIDDEFTEDIPEEPITQPGEIYLLGRHRVMCGDSTQIDSVMKLILNHPVDLVMTDPPYGIDANNMTMGAGKKEFYRGESDWDKGRPDINNIFAISKLACIWGGNYFADVLPPTNDWLCWHKKNDGRSFSEFELAWTNFENNCRIISHHWGGEEKLHVTMKPVEVIAWALKQPKVKCNTVCDLFGGAGTTMIACEQLGKTSFTMELDPKYVDVIIERYIKLVGTDENVFLLTDNGKKIPYKDVKVERKKNDEERTEK